MSPRLLSLENYNKLEALSNPHILKQVERFIKICKPAKVSVITDSPEDVAYVSQLSLDLGEEQKLNMKGHTVHFDGYYDQARDKTNTAVLTPQWMKLSKGIVNPSR